jgi:hypothetical protein
MMSMFDPLDDPCPFSKPPIGEHGTAVSLLLLLLVACLPVLSSSLATAAESAENAALLELQTERVIVFKDGYCLIVKRGAATTDDRGEIHLTTVPDAAVLGSFWATPREGRMIGMVAGWVDVTQREAKSLPCLETIEVLKANVGKSCSVDLRDGVPLSGVIQAVLTQETPVPISDAVRPSFEPLAGHLSSMRTIPANASAELAHSRLHAISGTHFVLRTTDGDVLIPAGDVKRLTVRDMQTTLARTVTTTERTKRLTFRFAEAGQRRELMIAYFRPGVRWIPTYRIQLPEGDGPQKMAEISLQAELINEAEDLIDTPIDIVVGVPNFRFRTIPSPLVLEQTLRDALQQAAPQLSGQFRNDLSNALFTQRAGEFRAPQPDVAAEPAGIALPPELTAAATQELFVYNLPKFRLRKGERAAIPIYNTPAPYQDVYTWDVLVKRSDIATAPSGSSAGSPLTLSSNEVWRQIQLTNTGTMPWTTGAALIMQGGQPLAQELLTYTSPKGSVRVPVTVAIDVRGSMNTEEVDRQLQALTWDGHHYAKIRQRVTLEVTSFKSQPIALEIGFRFGGRAEQASDDGKITLAPYREDDWNQYRGSPAVNNSSTVRWSLSLEPGKIFQPTVDYHFYARH